MPPALDFRTTVPRSDFNPPGHDDVRLSWIEAAMSAPVGREKCVLVAMAFSAPRVILSLATIAGRSGAGERTVRRYIETLEATGFVEVFERAGDGWVPRPPRGERKQTRRQLAFVLHLDGRSTRRPDDHHGLASRPAAVSTPRRRSVHC
jgi:hypothetical protein